MVRLYPERCHLCRFHTLNAHTPNIAGIPYPYTRVFYTHHTNIAHTPHAVVCLWSMPLVLLYRGLCKILDKSTLVQAHAHQTLTKCSYKHTSTAFANEPNVTLDIYCDLTPNHPKDEIHVVHTKHKDEVAERLTDMGINTRTKTTTNTAKISKKEKMLTNPEVKRWYDNLARGSEITADVRLRRLDMFCRTHEMTAMELADLGMKDVRTATNLLEDHITWMEDKGYAPGYISGFVKTFKSWLSHFDVEIRRRVKIKNPNQTPTLQDEKVPDEQEITELFSRASLRSAAMISLMAKSGLRPEVMGNHDGTDGLRMRDLPDVVIHQGVAKCITTPSRIMVRGELSKARHQYFTLLTTSGADKLLAYLNDRLACGEPLHGDSAVIAPDHRHKLNRGKNAHKAFLQTRQISKEIRNTFRPRFQWRPYILRAYFDTQLLIAESKGKMAHDFRVFFMGHKGSMEARYTTNKGVLPEMPTAEMRNAFARAEEFLDLEITARTNRTNDREKQEMIHSITQNATPEQLDSMLEALLSYRQQGADNIPSQVCIH